MDISNSQKAKSGAQSKKTLKTLLDQKQQDGIVLHVESRKFGYEGKKPDQFKCDYLLTFHNGKKWILFSANSLTTDRLKSKQWDAFHIKAIDDNIEKAFIICPNSKKKNSIHRYHRYIHKDMVKSSIDDVLLFDEFNKVINDMNPSTGLSGTQAAKKGLNFERNIKFILETDSFLDLWKKNLFNNEKSFQLFKMIMDKLELNKDNVYRLSATTNIPKLPEYIYKNGTTKNGGSPKTDVALTVYQKKTFTFSVKNSSSNDITVFEFPAKYCAEILNDDDLEDLLTEYEKCGGPSNMKKRNRSKATSLEKKIKKHLDEFHKWALRGTEKHYSEKIQLADFIIVLKGQRITIETIDECIDRIKKSRKKGNFGTIFRWTVTKKNKSTGKRQTRLKMLD